MSSYSFKMISTIKIVTAILSVFNSMSNLNSEIVNLNVYAKKSKCPGHFGGGTGVKNLCESHFPDSKSEKVWFIKFYAPWCGHCQSMKGDWEKLGKEFKNDEGIGIGGVDCDNDSNKALCGKYGVQGFPTIKTIIGGKPKAYNGAREYAALKQYIVGVRDKRGSKGGSSKCPKGLFKSSVKDSITPLCEKHYPNETSKFSWIIAFYKEKDFEQSDLINRLALEFGNEPVDKNKSMKKIVKQSARLNEIMTKYNVKSVATKEAGKSKDPLSKFGAICCDCDKKKGELDSKCNGTNLPHLMVYNAKKKKDYDYPYESAKFDIDNFTEFALQRLGYVQWDQQTNDKKEEL